MKITECINASLLQLENALRGLSNEQYSQPVKVLSNSSIGQHVRHVIEFLQCLDKGYITGEIDYDKRKRDKELENNKSIALECLGNIKKNLQKANKELVLNVNYSTSSDSLINIPTNYNRELLYNLEHIIHHMAIIRIGITETTKIELGEEFGIAPATLKYKIACAQSASYQ